MSSRGLPARGFVEALARDGGRIALSHFHRVRAETKADRTVVTGADRAIERMLVRAILRRFPDHGILGEEGGLRGRRGRLLWALDPLDGTSGYARGLPFFVISIALLEDGLPRMGCVHVPVLGETFFAVSGRGAFIGRRRLQPMRDGRPYGMESLLLLPSNAHRRYAIDFPGKGRCLGSSAGQACYVACGRADAALLRGSLWDIAAAEVILREAGGMLSYQSGRAIDWQELLSGKVAPEAILAGHPAALPELRRRIARKP